MSNARLGLCIGLDKGFGRLEERFEQVEFHPPYSNLLERVKLEFSN